MATEILMPALSPTMEEGTLAKWLKSEGDRVEPGDLLAEIETDKATMEFEAIEEGVLGRILVAEGTEGVKVNTPIAVILEEGEDASALPAKPSGNGQAAPEPQQAEAAEPAPEPAAPAPETESGAAAAATPAPAAPRAEDGSRIFASPLARRIATERGIDLRQVKGSGPHGRIVKADVEKAEPAAAEAPTEAPAAPAAERPAPPAGPDFDAVAKIYADRETEEVRLDGMRRTIAARLAEAKQTIPHFYLRRDIRLDALLDLRKRMNARAEARGVKLSVNDYIIKACALALQEVPEANAVWAGDRILKLRPSDVAVAVAVEGGLFTPVIRDAHAKTLSTISEEMRDLAERARARKLSPQEYQGGAFAISNLGMYGIDSFDAVINPPHGSILAVGAGVERPVAEEGRVALATVMTVTLSVDHRVIDGALGARFLDAVHGLIEDPMTMLI
jgi:pyruvate dehydrogenase E2 component (dihydrolipoamide acetyltransferase)